MLPTAWLASKDDPGAELRRSVSGTKTYGFDWLGVGVVPCSATKVVCRIGAGLYPSSWRQPVVR